MSVTILKLGGDESKIRDLVRRYQEGDPEIMAFCDEYEITNISLEEVEDEPG